VPSYVIRSRGFTHVLIELDTKVEAELVELNLG
jgi:hypothetical protein